MINETDRGLMPAPELTFDAASPANDLRGQMHAIVIEVLLIEKEDWTPTAPYTATYVGTLLMDSEQAYAHLDTSTEALNHVPVMVRQNGKDVVRMIKGRIQVKPRPIWPNALLFALTVLSLLYVGAAREVGNYPSLAQLALGGPYAFGVLLILGSHELGHYFAARRHKVAVTLPYFIPMPLIDTFGTLGAFIQLREPMRSRKILLDIGAAGPLVGLFFAIPVLLIGLRTSPVLPLPINDVFMLRSPIAAYSMEGNSILYAAAKFLVFGRFLPDGMNDVFINALAMAGWTGLLVTGLNLIPVGQLDGGHALYALIGDRARLLYLPVLVLMGAASVLYPSWAIWVFLLLILGRVYATPFNMITPLNPMRKGVAIACLVAFVLVFIPIPMQIVVVQGWF
jgi:hypothetical protein